MSCGKIHRMVQEYLDGTATSAERATVEVHVAGCEGCARVLSESRKLASLLAGMPERRVSDDFERSLQRRLQRAAPAAPVAAWWERFRLQFEWRLRVPAMVAAGSLAVALVAVVVTPIAEREQEHATKREQMVASVVERHEQLERANPSSNWEAVESSIELTTGSVVTE
jgi:anti-sigma factor RsiW